MISAPPFVSRVQWGARPPVATVPLRTGTQGVAVHWFATPVTPASHSQCAAMMRNVQNFHMDTRGWYDIAYNHVVCDHGWLFEGRGWNVQGGAQLASQNWWWPSVCWAGGPGLQGGRPSPEAYGTVGWVVREWQRRRPTAVGVRPHSSFQSTTCPGDHLRQWINNEGWQTGQPPNGGEPPMFTSEEVAFLKAIYRIVVAEQQSSAVVFRNLVEAARNTNPPTSGIATRAWTNQRIREETPGTDDLSRRIANHLRNTPQ